MMKNAYVCANCRTAHAKKIEVGGGFYITFCEECLVYFTKQSRNVNRRGSDPSPSKIMGREKPPIKDESNASSRSEKTILSDEEFQRNYQKQFKEFMVHYKLRKQRKCEACGVTYNDGIGCSCNKRW